MAPRKPKELGSLQARVLTGLAEGQNLDDLSDDMQLSEITVRLIAKTAAKNLGAASVEAAVAAFVSNADENGAGPA